MARARAPLAVAGLLAAWGGCIDSAPGIEWSYRSDPVVRLDQAADRFTVEAEFTVHVGTYALAGRGAAIERVEVLLDGVPVGWAAPSDVTGLGGAVAPGGSVDGRVVAEGSVSAFPRLAEVCDAAPQRVGVALGWRAEVDDSGGGGGPLRWETGRLEGPVATVHCAP